jgi:hypothetical protein
MFSLVKSKQNATAVLYFQNLRWSLFLRRLSSTVGLIAFLVVMLDAFYTFSVTWAIFLRTRTIGSNVR